MWFSSVQTLKRTSVWGPNVVVRQTSIDSRPLTQNTPGPRHIVPWVEGIPASSEIRLEPGGEIHRAVGRRYAHIAEIAGAVPRRNVHAAPEGNSKMCVVATDPAPLV